MRLEQRGNDSSVLVERFAVLREDALVVGAKRVPARRSRRIDRDALREKEHQFFPAKLARLHRAPVAVKAFVARDGRPGIRLAAFVGDGLVGDERVPVVGIDRPADLRAGGFLQSAEELADRLIEAVEGAFAGVPEIGHIKHEARRDKSPPVEFVPDQQVVGNPTIGRFHWSGFLGCRAGAIHPVPAMRVSSRSVS